jgi:hypothetical protein
MEPVMDAKALREKMKEKARRLAGGGDAQNVDSSSYTPPKGNPDGSAQVGMKPISRRAFKEGGKVEGMDQKACHAGRRARAMGGNIGLANTDQKAANDARPGKTQVGGYSKGGPTEIKGHEKRNTKMSIDHDISSDSVKKIKDTNEVGVLRAMKKGYATGGAPSYSKTAVDKEIGKDKRIKPREAAAINALLKGRQKSNEPDSDDVTLLKKSGGRAAKAGGGTLTMDAPLKMSGTLKTQGTMGTDTPISTDAPMDRAKPLQDQVTDAAMAQRASNAAEGYNEKMREAGDMTRRKAGGRTAKKDGGAVKKGSTNINIVIAPPARPGAEVGGAMPPPMPPPMPPKPPMPMPPIGGPAPAMMPPTGLGGVGMPPPHPGMMPPPGAPPMMARKNGGKVHMEFGAGGGKGRLEKIKECGGKA